MTQQPAIALIGTLDTKGAEIAYVRDRLLELGIKADVERGDVAREAGYELAQVQTAGSRGAAVDLMVEGVRAVCLRLWLEGRINGVLCLGGAEGALLGAAAMHALPVGVPKVIVSPSASGRRAFGPFVGESDVLVMHSVIDILGLNPIARSVFDNAAAAVAGMVRDAGRPVSELGGRSVGITMLGHTTPAVMRIREALELGGHEPVIFHANGVGGPAMEQLIGVGALAGVIDYTLSEVANGLLDGLHATGPERLTVAGKHGLPQVVVPGCVDFFNQGAPETVPERYRNRKSYYHNPVATLVRLDRDEMAELGRVVAQRLNESRGPVRVVAPSQGFSLADVEGGDLWDPDADAAFLEALSSGLRAETAFELVDTHVNDPAFADLVAERYLTLVSASLSAS